MKTPFLCKSGEVPFITFTKGERFYDFMLAFLVDKALPATGSRVKHKYKNLHEIVKIHQVFRNLADVDADEFQNAQLVDVYEKIKG